MGNPYPDTPRKGSFSLIEREGRPVSLCTEMVGESPGIVAVRERIARLIARGCRRC